MHVRINHCTRVCAIIVGLFIIANRQPLAAQTPNVNATQRCVVAATGNAAQYARRLAGTTIEVAELSFTENYDVCNARAKALPRGSVYLVAAADVCPREKFWRERLVSADPRLEVRVVVWQVSDDARQCAAQQLTATHRALVASLPRYRQTFDANLAAELMRLARQSANDDLLAAR